MSFTKTFFIGALGLFLVIGAVGYFKKSQEAKPLSEPLREEIAVPEVLSTPAIASFKKEEKEEKISLPAPVREVFPEVDRIYQLFALDSSKFPFVETVSYTSRVPWLKGRPAWIADYATHFKTSRHFIARSLNRSLDYFTQKVSPGDRFNVFKKEANIEFYLLIDLSRLKMWFYCFDIDSNIRYLLKTYQVGVGRLDPKKPSGSLTPIGKYLLGDKIAIYKPGTTGFFQDQKMEMIRVFGTRWIPFEKEVEGCTEGAKGFGLHGLPWIENSKGELFEDKSKIGKYESDGCVRLASEDIEEIFSIIITKPAYALLVKDFHEAKLPGVEAEIPENSPLKPKL